MHQIFYSIVLQDDVPVVPAVGRWRDTDASLVTQSVLLLVTLKNSVNEICTPKIKCIIYKGNN